MVNFNSNKELVDTYSFSTIGAYREMSRKVIIDGRTYIKQGTLQAITLVGNLYNIEDETTKRTKKVLLVGMSKQHPCDSKVDRGMALEVANENAHIDPVIVMEVGQYFDKYDFINIAKVYVPTLKLEFVKTTEEIMKSGRNIKKYNR